MKLQKSSKNSPKKKSLGGGKILMMNNRELKRIKIKLLMITTSVKTDIEPMLKGWSNRKYRYGKSPPQMYAIPRIIFPEIDGLGRLRYGEKSQYGTAKNAVKFMREYFGRTSKHKEIYTAISGFLYNVYRHGLMHSNYPKKMIIYGKDRGWAISFSDAEKDESSHLQFLGEDKTQFCIDCHEFYRDFLDALDKYKDDFDDTKKQAELLNNFNIAYPLMISAEQGQYSIKRKNILQDSDFEYFK
ncbi:MAG: hypothetical protein ABIH68_03290 [bacterium]